MDCCRTLKGDGQKDEEGKEYNGVRSRVQLIDKGIKIPSQQISPKAPAWNFEKALKSYIREESNPNHSKRLNGIK